jgi:glycosyltransferase involved in cell wall biosynthesis
MSKPVFVISSPFDTYSGYGARSRDLIKVLIELDKYDVKLLPQRWGDTPLDFCKDHAEWEYLLKYSIPMPLRSKPDIWMQITIPPEYQAVGKYNIGCTAGIESTGCDGGWIDGMNRMDMNFVSSNHSKEIFTNAKFEKKDKNTQQNLGVLELTKPIEVIFEGVDTNVYKHLPSKDITLDLKQIKESFCFLFVGHWMNGDIGHDRKNVGLMIKYFFDAFKGKKNSPALILKVSNGRNSYMSREIILDRILAIKKHYKGVILPNVYILNGGLSDDEMNQLYNHPKVKAMVSFTKGEGYGRPLAEFGMSKKPIIASGWSGHRDFLVSENTILLPGSLENVHASAANKWLLKESKWFQVSPKHAIGAFTDVHKKYKTFTERSRKQSHHIKTSFSWENMKDLIEKVLNKNIPDFPKQIELKLPELKLPKLK